MGCCLASVCKHNAESPKQGTKRVNSITKTIHFAHLGHIIYLWGSGKSTSIFCTITSEFRKKNGYFVHTYNHKICNTAATLFVSFIKSVKLRPLFTFYAIFLHFRYTICGTTASLYLSVSSHNNLLWPNIIFTLSLHVLHAGFSTLIYIQKQAPQTKESTMLDSQATHAHNTVTLVFRRPCPIILKIYGNPVPQ